MVVGPLPGCDPVATRVEDDVREPSNEEASMSQHTFVLCRRVGRPLTLAECALTTMPADCYGGLTFVGPFERRAMTGPWGSGPAEREAPAELRTGRRSAERVVVELGPWAHDASELRVRPASRRLVRWGGRRQMRYFDRAREAIDALARALEHEVPATPKRLPETRTA